MSLGEYIGAGSGTTKLLLHLNGNSTDSSGNGNNGSDTAITYSQANGKFGQGAGFNGSSSRIEFPTGSIQPTTFTAFAWVSPVNNVTGNYVLFGNMRDDSDGMGTKYKGWIMKAYRVTGNYLTISCETFNGTRSSSSSIIYTSSVTTDGTRATIHLVAITYDGSITRIFLDGKLVGTSGAGAIVYSTNGRPTLGCERRYLTSLDYFWSGICDEFGVVEYMTPQQVAKYYTYSRGFYATL